MQVITKWIAGLLASVTIGGAVGGVIASSSESLSESKVPFVQIARASIQQEVTTQTTPPPKQADWDLRVDCAGVRC